MDGFGKLLAENYSVIQIVWARYAFAIPIVLLMANRGTWQAALRFDRPWLQLLRGVLPLVASMSVIVGLTLMPLADFTAISFASPLLVVALAAPVLKERISVHSWIGVLCGFLGILIIVRPGVGVIAWAALFPLATAFLFALYQLLTRLVSRVSDPLVSLGWIIFVGFALTTPMLPFAWQEVTGRGWALLVLTGLLFGMGHFLVIRAFSIAPAAVLTPFTYVQIVAAIAFGIAVFGEVPDLWAMAGTALIIASGLYVLRRQPA